MKNRKKVLFITQAALVGAMYVALTWVSNALGLASFAIQLRLGEALCILPYFMPGAVWGLFVGCIISNLTMGAVVWDVLLGSLATLIGAFVASKLKNRWLVPLPTVLSNTIIVPVVILFCYTEVRSLSAYLLTVAGVFVGEVASAYVLGMVLLMALDRKKSIFTNTNFKH